MTRTMSREEIAGTLCRLAAEQVGADPASVSLDTDLFADLNFDSLNAVEYTMEIEEAFDIAVPDERADGVKTVGQAMDMLIAVMREPPSEHRE